VYVHLQQHSLFTAVVQKQQQQTKLCSLFLIKHSNFSGKVEEPRKWDRKRRGSTTVPFHCE